MPIDYVDEYVSLRQEMLERFEKIHDTLKYGIGGFIAFLSFYLAVHKIDGIVPIPNMIALFTMFSIVLFMGLSVLNNFRHIYRIGTYIAFIIESTNGVRWHRMSRRYGDYLKYLKKKNKLKWWEIAWRWGADSTQLAIVLIALFLGSFAIVVVKAENLYAWVPSNSIEWFIFSILVILNIALFVSLWPGMQRFREKTEIRWGKYRKDFGTKEFPDRFQ